MAELRKKRDSSPDNFQTEIVRVKKPKTAVVVDWQTRPVQTDEVERREEMVVTNPVILALIFSRLPPADLKTAALVCRTWSSVLEIPRFWAWASVRLGRENFSERRRSARLRHVGGVLTELDLTARQLRSLLRLVVSSQSGLSSLNVSGSDLSSVSPRLLSRATVRLARATFYDTNLSPDQVSALFTRIWQTERWRTADFRLERLRISLTSLKNVHPWILCNAVVRLGKISLLSSANITEDQLAYVLEQVAQSPVLNLKKLKLDGLDFSSVDPGVFSQALVRLEQVELFGNLLTEEQWLQLFQLMATTRQLKLRSLRLAIASSVGDPYLNNALIRSLALIPPGVLSQALVRLEKLVIYGYMLDPPQVKALFKAIVQTPELRLRRLTAHFCMWSFVGKRMKHYISEGLVRLETVDIVGLGSCFEPKVADAICKKILATEELTLRSLKMGRSEDFPASPTLFNQVKTKIKVLFEN